MFLAFLGMATPEACSAGEPHLQFRNVIRTLEVVQDATASGDHKAAELQSKLIVQIETDLKNAKQVDLQDERNLKAVAIYLFSGGNPNLAESKLASLTIDPQSKELLDGALAYARGDKLNAIKFLGSIDLSHLPSNLAGRISLVKAILTSAEDLKAALQLLSAARAFMPGTLVEEAALRRCISFAGKIPDIEQLEICASLYIRRFPSSIYWQEFEDNFSFSLIEVDYLNSHGTLPRLSFILNDLDPTVYRRMLLLISKQAIGRGRFLLANSTATNVLDVSGEGSVEMARANLYVGATMIVQEHFEAGKEKLEKIDKSLLDADDKSLLEKAMKLALQIAERPEVVEEEAIKPPAVEASKNSQPSEFSNLLARAEKALADPSPPK